MGAATVEVRLAHGLPPVLGSGTNVGWGGFAKGRLASVGVDWGADRCAAVLVLGGLEEARSSADLAVTAGVLPIAVTDSLGAREALLR